MLHSTGPEFERKYIFEDVDVAPSLRIGMYNQSDDNLSVSSDLDDITTEPDDGQYARRLIDLDTDWTIERNADDDWGAVMNDSNAVFYLDGTTGLVDSYFIICEFDRTGDGELTQHLYWTAALQKTYDLSDYTELDLRDCALHIT